MLKRELKINFKSLLVWSSVVAIMLIMVFSIYPSLMKSENIKMMDELINMFPQELMRVFNMDIISISSVYGWIKTEGYMFICLFGSIYSSMLGANILWFLISKPVKRNQIVTSKILCGIINIFSFSMIIFIINMIGLLLSNEMIWKEFLLISFVPLMLYYLMFFISLLISVIIKKSKTMTGISLIVVFIPYLFQMIGSISDNIKILKQISFFEFVSIRYIIENAHINYIYLIISIIIIIISVFITYTRYNDKELV
jgi:ABC-2 type transport system permease protein